MAEEERRDGERDGGDPLNPSIPQDEREEVPQDEREGAPQDDPSIRRGENPTTTQGERRKRGGGPKTAAGSFETALGPPQDERPKRTRGGGPKTDAGKAVVARNPIKHGVLAQTPVIPGVESEEDWQRLRRGVLEFFELEGPFFEALGDQVAATVWRLYRVMRFETEAIRQYIEDVPADQYASLRLEGRAAPDAPTKADVEEMNRMMLSRLMPGDETMDKVMRYETRLHRFLLQKIYLIMVMKGLKKTRVSRFWGLPDLNAPEISNHMGMPPSPGS